MTFKKGVYNLVRGKTLLTHKKPDIELPSFNASIHNRFDVEVIDSCTGKLKKKARGFNVICNHLWELLCSNSGYFSCIHYGTGSGTPSTADTSLFSFLGYQTPSGYDYEVDWETGVAYVRRSIQLTASTAVGQTITEVGIASSSSSTSLCTHAMLEDMNGNAISIEKTDTDIVNIYATVYIHFNSDGYGGGPIRLYSNKGGYAGNIFTFIAGIEGSLPTSRVWFMTDRQMYGGSTYCYPSTSNYKTSSFTYDPQNKKVICTISRLEASEMNLGGIRRICMGGYYAVITERYTNAFMHFDVGGTWYPYSEIEGEPVGTGDGNSVDFALDFPYAHDAKVYIDGVETTDFTLDYGPHTATARYHVEELLPISTAENHIPVEGSSNNSFVGSRILYNPAYGIGLSTIYLGANVELYASDDCDSWELVTASSTSSRTFSIPEEFIHKKYWKGVNKATSASYCYAASFVSTYTDKKLHFKTPPVAGSVITADYKTDTIAKDSNHVFDMRFELCFSEHTEAQ